MNLSNQIRIKQIWDCTTGKLNLTPLSSMLYLRGSFPLLQWELYVLWVWLHISISFHIGFLLESCADAAHFLTHTLVQVMSTEMYCKQLQPSVHTDTAAWRCGQSAPAIMLHFMQWEHTENKSTPVTVMQCVKKQQEEDKQGSWLRKVRYSACQLVHQLQQAFSFQHFLFSFITLLLLPRLEIFKIWKETK